MGGEEEVLGHGGGVLDGVEVTATRTIALSRFVGYAANNEDDRCFGDEFLVARASRELAFDLGVANHEDTPGLSIASAGCGDHGF